MIFIASKVKHAPMWRELRSKGVPICSTWIDEAGPGETKSIADLWSRCIDEASSALVTIVYKGGWEEILNGALVEAGAALASGKRVIWVGDLDVYSAALHPRSVKARNIYSALNVACGFIAAHTPGLPCSADGKWCPNCGLCECFSAVALYSCHLHGVGGSHPHRLRP